MVDPYDWLGVPLSQRPPTHYQLLAVPSSIQFEHQINAAAAAQLAKLAPHRDGPHAASAARIEREIEEARDTLLDPERRRLYDVLAPDVDAPDDEVPAVPPPELPVTVAAPSSPPGWWSEAVPETKPVVPTPVGRLEAPPRQRRSRSDDKSPVLRAKAAVPWWTNSVPEEAPVPLDAEWTQSNPEHEVGRMMAATAPAVATMPSSPIEPPSPSRPRPNLVPLVICAMVIAVIGTGGVLLAIRGNKKEVEVVDRTAPSDRAPAPAPPPLVFKPTPEEQTVVPKPIEPPTPPKVVVTPPVKPMAVEPTPPKTVVKKPEAVQPRLFRGHLQTVTGIAFNAEGSLFFTSSNDKTARRWDDTGESKILHGFDSPSIACVAYSDGKRFAACDGLTVALFESRGGGPVKLLESPRSGVRALAVSNDGTIVATALSDGFVRIWQTDSAKFDEWTVAGKGGAFALDLSIDGKVLYVVGSDGAVSGWTIATKRKQFQWVPHKDGITSMRRSPDGRTVATGGVDGVVVVYDLATRRELIRFTGHQGPVFGLDWSPDGQFLATAGADSMAHLWNASTGKSAGWSQPLEAKPATVAIDPKQRFVLVGLLDGTIKRAPLPGGEPVVESTQAKPPVSPVAIPSAKELEAANAELAKALPKDASAPVAALRLGTAANQTAPLRYAALKEAIRLAGKADSVDIAEKAAISLAAWFDVDDFSELLTALSGCAGKQSPDAMAEAVLSAVERAEMNQRPEMVEQFLAIADRIPKIPDAQRRRVNAARFRLNAAAAEITRIKAATAVLRANPDDGDANQTYARFLCLTRQHWTMGAIHLARSIDPLLKEAGSLERLATKDLRSQLRLAELWVAYGQRQADFRERRAAGARAREWAKRASESKLAAADEGRVKAVLLTAERLDLASTDLSALPLLTPSVERRGYDSMSARVREREWTTEGDCTSGPEGLKLNAGALAVRSLFDLLPGSKVRLELLSDGRAWSLVLAGQELMIPAGGKSLRIVVDYVGEEVKLAVSVDGAAPSESKMAVPPAERRPTNLVLRPMGEASTPGGAIVVAAILRGPVQPAVPKLE